MIERTSLADRNGIDRPSIVPLLERGFGPIFRDGGSVEGVRLEVGYKSALRDVILFFTPSLTKEELEDFKRTAARFVIISYPYGDPMIGIGVDREMHELVLGRKGWAWTLPTSRGDMGRVIIGVNLESLSRDIDIGEQRFQPKPSIKRKAVRQLVRQMMAHELIHHILAVVGMPLGTQDPFERRINSISRTITQPSWSQEEVDSVFARIEKLIREVRGFSRRNS